MKRPELEALIWRKVPALTAGRPESRVRAMDLILAAVDAYAAAVAGATLGEIDGYRRGRRPGRPPATHFQRPGAPERTPVCFGRASGSPVTSEPEDVTCRVCKRSGAWRDAEVMAS